MPASLSLWVEPVAGQSCHFLLSEGSHGDPPGGRNGKWIGHLGGEIRSSALRGFQENTRNHCWRYLNILNDWMCVYYITLTFLAVILNFIVMAKEWIVLFGVSLPHPSDKQGFIFHSFNHKCFYLTAALVLWKWKSLKFKMRHQNILKAILKFKMHDLQLSFLNYAIKVAWPFYQLCSLVCFF